MAYANLGRRVIFWDEFSHWATVVKQMTLSNILGSNRDAVFVTFQDYPPAMALFQYFVQKVFLLVDPSAGFCDWRLYFAYQLFMYSFLFPFLSSLDFKRPYSYILLIAVLFSPFLIFSDSISSLYIDAFLGLLSGAGLAMVFSKTDKDPLCDVTVLLIISTLTLTKAAGLLFSLFLAIAYMVSCNSAFFSSKSRKCVNLKCILPAAAFAAIPKILWEISLKINGVLKHFSGKVLLTSLIHTFTDQTTDSYRISVLGKYFHFLLNEKVITVFNYEIPIPLFFSLLFLLLLCSVLIFMNRFPQRRTEYKTLFWLVFVQTVIYVIGLLFTYMFNFSEREALALASCDRYLRIIFNSLWMLSILAFTAAFRYIKLSKSLIAGLILCVMLSTSQLDTFIGYIRRYSVNRTVHMYEDIDGYFDHVIASTEENSKIYFISQEDTGYDFWMNKYNLMPRTLNPYYCTWSIGEPFFDGDIWTLPISADAWGSDLVENFDYVALFKLNDYFYKEFGVLFENPDEIAPYSVYRVNKQTGMLSLIE